MCFLSLVVCQLCSNVLFLAQFPIDLKVAYIEMNKSHIKLIKDVVGYLLIREAVQSVELRAASDEFDFSFHVRMKEEGVLKSCEVKREKEPEGGCVGGINERMKVEDKEKEGGGI